jgi:hypothetical protein
MCASSQAMLANWTPFRELDTAKRRMQRMLGDFFSRRRPSRRGVPELHAPKLQRARPRKVAISKP